jgi:hypothetical protein
MERDEISVSASAEKVEMRYFARKLWRKMGEIIHRLL